MVHKTTSPVLNNMIHDCDNLTLEQKYILPFVLYRYMQKAGSNNLRRDFLLFQNKHNTNHLFSPDKLL